MPMRIKCLLEKDYFHFFAVLLALNSIESHADSWRHIEPVLDQDYYQSGAPDPDKVALGRLLFFDKVLSGNRNTSCATCHHPLTSTGDGLSLPLGEGALGLGVTRAPGQVHSRVPRNSPALFNVGAKEFEVMFHDGRVLVDSSAPSGFDAPAGDDLPLGLDNVLAAQAMFPVTSPEEMAGQAGKNSIADAAAAGYLAGPGGVWDLLARRLQEIPEYVTLFQAAYPDVYSSADIRFVHAANAIAAFEAEAWRADDSPFDRFLRGEPQAMSGQAKHGMRLFYGRANCGSCHSGPFQTDHQFHAIAMPQIGPGKGDGHDGHSDFGRERVTGNPEDRYRFRTPSLRNVVLSGPWGHSGAFSDLREVIYHHAQPEWSLRNYNPETSVLPSRPDLDSKDFVVMSDPQRVDAIAQANELPERPLSDREVESLVAFLEALTDHGSLNPHEDVPQRVPSGLSVFD